MNQLSVAPMLERPATDKHSSLLRTFVNYRRKTFYDNGPQSAQSTLSFLVKTFLESLSFGVLPFGRLSQHRLRVYFIAK